MSRVINELSRTAGTRFPALIGIATFLWWGGLRAPVTPRAMLAGVLFSWQGHPCQTGQRVEARYKSDPTGPPGWGLGRGLIILSCKKELLQKPEAE